MYAVSWQVSLTGGTFYPLSMSCRGRPAKPGTDLDKVSEPGRAATNDLERMMTVPPSSGQFVPRSRDLDCAEQTAPDRIMDEAAAQLSSSRNLAARLSPDILFTNERIC